MAGNADWVIDADKTNLKFSPNASLTSSGNKSNPQQTPTPSQSGITSATPETYWTGALSSWAIDCVNKGYAVETLPYNGQITYNDVSNPQDLSKYQVYIVDEPNILFTAAEKTAIMQFVQNGGGLFMIADHDGSDRNFDGVDAPHVWNDLLGNNSVKNRPFGIYFDLVDFSQTTTNISATSTDSIINGPMGTVTKVQWAGGTTMSLAPSDNPTVKGVVYKTGTTPGNTNAMVAYSRYGNGKIAAIGDSSPTDDSTGNPDCTLYNGYWRDASGKHRPLLMNITIWLASKNPTTNTFVPDFENMAISVSPNPSTGIVTITTAHSLTNVEIKVYNLTGSEILTKKIPEMAKGEPCIFNLSKGFYLARVQGERFIQTVKIYVE